MTNYRVNEAAHHQDGRSRLLRAGVLQALLGTKVSDGPRW